jgi:hypothetical protein
VCSIYLKGTPGKWMTSTCIFLQVFMLIV